LSASGIRLPLKLHPDSRCDALTGLEVEVARLGPRRLFLRFLPTPGFRHVRSERPRWGAAERRDELWRHTCFEAFIRAGGESAYYEFNLAMSGDWNAYRLSGYRKGMEPLKEADPPSGDPFWRAPPSAPAFSAVLELERLAALPVHEPWHVGLSAVIEERNRRISYWALEHPRGAPDFHHPDCFALELPAARPA
jgi:hypothetical protein